MRTFDHQMTLIQRSCDFLSRLAPEHERDMRLLIDSLNDARRKFLPPHAAMRMRLMRTHGEHRIQQHHALPSPCFKATVIRAGRPKV